MFPKMIVKMIFCLQSYWKGKTVISIKTDGEKDNRRRKIFQAKSRKKSKEETLTV